MKISKIIRRILADWEIDLDFTDADIKSIEASLQQVSAIEKRMIHKALKEYHRNMVKEAFGGFTPMAFEINLN